jgi:hypothetical protein
MVRPSTLKAKRFKTDKRPFLEVVDGDGHLVLRVRQATAQGYIECDPNGVCDLAYPNSELRRARVKDRGRIAGTLMAGDTQQCVFIEYKE